MSNEPPYEFSSEQSDLLRRLARLMKYAGILFIFLGIMIGTLCGFTIMNHPLRGASYLVLTIISVSFGVWTNNVSYSLKLIVETTGKDMDLLMEAMKTMKLMYTLQFIWLIIMTFLSLGILLMSTLPGFQIL